MRLDIDSGELVYITEWLKDIQGLIFNRNDAYFGRQTVLNDNQLMVPFCNANVPLYVAPSIAENYKERHTASDWEYLMAYFEKELAEEYETVKQFF
ncbi:MAG: hypothetical protein OSJ72_09620 [Lachnospiraceae bacterium]|nr:hypothetical protein [Lachnospiraceae bacterium]